jgi:hypothetical protein
MKRKQRRLAVAVLAALAALVDTVASAETPWPWGIFIGLGLALWLGAIWFAASLRH